MATHQAIAQPRQWTCTEGFLLLGKEVPPVRLHPNNAPSARQPANFQLLNTVNPEDSTFSILAKQTSRKCYYQANSYLLSQACRIRDAMLSKGLIDTQHQVVLHPNLAALNAGSGGGGSNSQFAAVGLLTSLPRSGNTVAERAGASSNDHPWELNIFDWNLIEAYSHSSWNRRSSAVYRKPTYVKQESDKNDAASAETEKTGGAAMKSDEEAEFAEIISEGPLHMQSISVWAKSVQQFTGLFTGKVVGIIGDITKRNTEHAVTAVVLTELIQPPAPLTRWSVSPRSLVSNMQQQATTPLRVQWCSGPFPAHSRNDILTSLVANAMTRQVDVLCIAGPFVQQSDDVSFAQETYADQMMWVEQQIPLILEKQKKTKVILVPSIDDMLSQPVLPQLPFDILTDLQLASNPAEFVVEGIHFGVSSFDAINHIKNQSGFLERGFASNANTSRYQNNTLKKVSERIADAVLNSGLYVPMLDIPSPVHDLSQLNRMAIAKPNPVPNNKSDVDLVYPHVMLMSSGAPPFAALLTGASNPEVDTTEEATEEDKETPKILTVNCGQCPDRTRKGFTLSVSEITIPNPAAFLASGPTDPSNKVSVGTILLNYPF